MFRTLLAACLLAPTLGFAATPIVAWSTALNQPIYADPQADGGNLYLTSQQPSGPNVFALSGASGKPLWSFATQGGIGIPPTVGASQLFVASDIGSTHYLRAISTKTGSLIWQYTRDQPPECMCSQASILSGGLLFAQSDGHSLFAFAPSGAAPAKRLWQFRGDGAPLTSPVAAGGLVVFGSGDHNLYALNAKSGATVWTGSTGYVFTAPPYIAAGTVVIGDTGGNIDGFDLKTGKPLWSDGAGEIDAAAVGDGPTAYLVSQDRNLYAITIATGATAWTYAMDDYSAFSPLLADHLVVAANRAGQLVAVHAKDGSPAWTADLNGTPFSQPIFWPAQNAIILKIGDHEIGAYNAATGKNLWVYTTPLVVTAPVIQGDEVAIATDTGTVIGLR